MDTEHETREFTVFNHRAKHLRRLIEDRVWLRFTVRGHWLLERRFTVTGPKSQLDALAQEFHDFEAQDFEDRQW